MGSPRASTIYLDRIEYTMQLIFDDKGGARMTRIQGKLASNERALDLTVTLPITMFKRPSLTASIKVDPSQIEVPPIDMTTLGNALRDQFGADVLITIDRQEQPE